MVLVTVHAAIALALAAALLQTSSIPSGTYRPPTVKSDACLACHPQAAGHGNHVVGVVYVDAQRVGEMLRPATAQSGFGSTVARDLLVDGRVECSSCHLTHDETTALRYRLRSRDPLNTTADDYRREYRALCTACHDMR